MKTGYDLPLRSITPFEFILVWKLHLRYIMMKHKFMAVCKNEDVFLTTLSRKFREAGYNLTAGDCKKKEEKNQFISSITPINSDDGWCFNVCKTDGH